MKALWEAVSRMFRNERTESAHRDGKEYVQEMARLMGEQADHIQSLRQGLIGVLEASDDGRYEEMYERWGHDNLEAWRLIEEGRREKFRAAQYVLTKTDTWDSGDEGWKALQDSLEAIRSQTGAGLQGIPRASLIEDFYNRKDEIKLEQEAAEAYNDECRRRGVAPDDGERRQRIREWVAFKQQGRDYPWTEDAQTIGDLIQVRESPLEAFDTDPERQENEEKERVDAVKQRFYPHDRDQEPDNTPGHSGGMER